MAKSLFVGNIPYQISEPELEEMFSQAGTVDSVTVMRDRMTGRPRGFAFVSMTNDDEAEKAIQQFDGASIGGRTIAVNEARPRPERGPGDFGGGFGGGGGGAGGLVVGAAAVGTAAAAVAVADAASRVGETQAGRQTAGLRRLNERCRPQPPSTQTG